LVISDLDVKVGDKKDEDLKDGEKISRKAKPGDRVKFDVEIENMFSSASDIQIENIEVIITIENIDDEGDDDLEEEETIDDIDAGDDDSVVIEFTIPTLVDEGDYDVIIEVDAEDEDGNDQGFTWNLILEVEKDKHDLLIEDADLSPSIVRCDRNPSLEVEVVNIGREDEDEVRVEITNTRLGIDAEIELDELEEGDDEDAKDDAIFRLQIDDDVKPGIYPITVKAYYNGKVGDEETVDLIVEKCVEAVTPLEGEPVDLIKTTDKVAKPTAPVTKISFKQTSEYLTLMAILFVILLGGVVFLIGATVIVLKKR